MSGLERLAWWSSGHRPLVLSGRLTLLAVGIGDGGRGSFRHNFGLSGAAPARTMRRPAAMIGAASATQPRQDHATSGRPGAR